MEEDRNKTSSIRETSIGDYCDDCGRYLDKRYEYCPDCNCRLLWNEEKETNGK